MEQHSPILHSRCSDHGPGIASPGQMPIPVMAAITCLTVFPAAAAILLPAFLCWHSGLTLPLWIDQILFLKKERSTKRESPSICKILATSALPPECLVLVTWRCWLVR